MKKLCVLILFSLLLSPLVYAETVYVQVERDDNRYVGSSKYDYIYMNENTRINVIVNIIRTLVLTLLSFITFPWICRYLGESAVEKVFSDANWIPTDTVPLPKKKNGMAVLKDHQSISEKMIEQGRAKNVGCYVISWMFIIIVVVAAAYGIARLLGVL